MAIARKLSQNDFGVYNLVLALMFIGGMIVNFGMESVIIREVAKDQGRAGIFLSNSILLSLIFALITWPMAVGLAYLLHYGAEAIFLISFGGAVFIFMGVGQVASAVIKGYQRMEIFAGTAICQSLLGLGLNLFVLWAFGTVASLIAVLFITEGFKAVVCTSIVHRHFAALKWSLDRRVMFYLLRLSVPFALLMAYGVLLHRADLLMLGWLRPLDEVAVYGMAARLIDCLSLISASLIGALYPALSAKMTSDRSDLWNIFSDSVGVFVVCAFGAGAMIIVLAKPIILMLFGHTYVTGVATLRWLGCAFLFSMLSGPAGTLLLAAGDQMRRLLVVAMVLLGSNIVLCLWLIPTYGGNGAAISVLFSTVLGFGFRLFLCRKYFGRMPHFATMMWRPLAASLLMGALLGLLRNAHVLILAALGGLVYVSALAMFGEFKAARYDSIRLKLSRLFPHNRAAAG